MQDIISGKIMVLTSSISRTLGTRRKKAAQDSDEVLSQLTIKFVLLSNLGGVKSVILYCFKHFSVSAPFLNVVKAYSCNFYNAFRYKSGHF